MASASEKADATETELYSGSVRVSKELSALQSELESLRRRQGELEDEVLAIMEQVEGIEAEIAGIEDRRGALGREAEALRAALGRGETEIDAQLEELASQREATCGAVAAPLLQAYERLRSHPRLGGIAAVALVKRDCSGCRISIPIDVAKRIQAAPPDALVTCTQCQRLLVR